MSYEMRISDWSSDVCSSDLRYAMSGIVRLGSSASAASTSAQPPKDVMEIVREGDINWMASRFGADLPIAILARDPSKPGPYVMRVKFAPGHMSKPHFHKETRYVLEIGRASCRERVCQ